MKKPRSAELLLALAAVLPFPVAAAESATPSPIRRVVLDPYHVLSVPVAQDRQTTIRFPSPVSDLVSALVATEIHPAAHFLLTFQPGESFLSVRALRPKAATTLNVVWHSQTYVLELQESPEPCLSLILEEPAPIRPSRPSKDPGPPPKTDPNPARKYLDTVLGFDALKRDYPQTLAHVDRVSTWSLRTVDDVEIRAVEVYHFRDDHVGVARVVLSNPTGPAVDWGAGALQVHHDGRLLPVLGSDFDGALGVLEARTVHVVFRFPEDRPVTDPTALWIVVPSKERFTAPKKPEPRPAP